MRMWYVRSRSSRHVRPQPLQSRDIANKASLWRVRFWSYPPHLSAEVSIAWAAK